MGELVLPSIAAAGSIYPHLKVGAAALLENENKVLLLRRAHDPFVNAWSLPSVYVEVDEDPRDAAIRETLEETGLQISIEDVLGTYFFDDDPRGNGVLIVYRAAVMGK